MRRIYIDVDLTDRNGNDLKGSTFALLSEDGDLIEVWENDKDLYIENLPNGTYVIDQITPPEGYKVNDNTFEFVSDTEFQITEVKVDMSNNKKLIK